MLGTIYYVFYDMPIDRGTSHTGIAGIMSTVPYGLKVVPLPTVYSTVLISTHTVNYCTVLLSYNGKNTVHSSVPQSNPETKGIKLTLNKSETCFPDDVIAA